jgi:diacylglycerol kinase family enzyme
MRVMVVYNPISGRGRSCKLAVAIAELLLRVPCDVELVQTQATPPEQWLKPKLLCDPDAIVVVGGDGTLRQVASVVVETEIPLYHAACGTENLFANSMCMLSPPKVVVSAIENGKTATIDTATANGEFMVLMASVGFDAGVVADLAKHRGTSITHLSYIAPIICQLFKWNPPNITISVDGKELVVNKKGWAVVANSKAYARGLNPARDAIIDDGKLDVVFLPLSGRLSVWKWIRLMKRGTHLHHPEAVYARGENIKVQTAKLSPWQIDGDSIGGAIEMKIKCVPRSLTVLTVCS